MVVNDIINETKIKLAKLTFKDGSKISDAISSPVVNNNTISFILFITKDQYEESLLLREKAISILQQELKDIKKISIVISNKNKEIISSKIRSPTNNIINKIKIPKVKHIIPVIAGKGGVGKSTISVALAQNLKDMGFKVGLLDADLYGPSIPIMFDINEKVQLIQGKIVPIIKEDIDILSISLLTKSNSALAWRGAMISKAIHQLLMAKWNNIDYLILDMPPGTGDIHITLITNYEVFGTLAVTTPQLVSTSEVKKSLNLYRKLGVNLLGIIENMSYLLTSDQNTIFPFGKNGAQNIANEFQIPLLAQIPINPEISLKCDQGKDIKHLINVDWKKLLD